MYAEQDTGKDGEILPYIIQRNARHPFDFYESNTISYVNFWIPLVNDRDYVFGAVGLQLKQADYEKLVPSSVMEKPYSVTYISALDQDINVIWSYSEDLDAEEEDFVVK